jgi:hypothetical protein
VEKVLFCYCWLPVLDINGRLSYIYVDAYCNSA